MTSEDFVLYFTQMCSFDDWSQCCSIFSNTLVFCRIKFSVNCGFRISQKFLVAQTAALSQSFVSLRDCDTSFSVRFRKLRTSFVTYDFALNCPYWSTFMDGWKYMSENTSMGSCPSAFDLHSFHWKRNLVVENNFENKSSFCLYLISYNKDFWNFARCVSSDVKLKHADGWFT